MQTERYIFFTAVAFTDRAHMSHQTLIRVLRPLPMRAPSPQHPKCSISFPRGNLILARGRSSVRPETRTHSELWCESGPVPFGVLPECTAAPARCFSTSPSHLALPGESRPLSDWSLLQHSHLLTDMPFSKAYPSHESDGNPAVNRRVFDGSVILPLLSARTRGAYSFFRIASNWTLSRWVASPIAKLVSPSSHLSVQVVTSLSGLSPGLFPSAKWPMPRWST